MNEPVGGPTEPSAATAEPAVGSSRVLAVLVCRDGGPFLERTLTALAASTVRPDRLIAVDTSSDDDTVSWLTADGSPVSEVLQVPADTGFATAVHTGVDTGGASDYVWVLHDDCAPTPTALAELLSVLEEQSTVAVAGPKVLGWDEPRRLLEVGVSISRSGRRYTGLEAREQDQGQFDAQRDVLAVGSAGLLVRRAVWDGLGGFDRALRLFREDVDLGWRVNLADHRVVVVPGAVVHHAEAASHGRRDVTLDSRVHRADRAGALYVLLANTSRWALLPRWLWLMLVSLLRALGFVLGKAPQEAADEVSAISQVLLRPGRLRRARRARRRHRKVPARSLRPLFPPPGHQVRQSLESVSAALKLDGGTPSTSMLESGPSDEDLDSFVGQSSGRLRRVVRRPGLLLFSALLLLALAAWRGLYRGGVLHGGGLLPVPTGASDVWSDYLATWHPVTAGSPVATSPASAVLALLGTVLLGKATWAVPLVMVVGPALAGLLAYLVLAALGLSKRSRVWAAAAYALNPALLSAVAQGRWGTVLVAVLLPLLGLAVARTCGVGRESPSTQGAAAAALLMSVVVAVTPALWLPLVALGVLAAWRLAASRGARWRLAAVLVAPAVVWVAWLPAVLSDPALLALEPGVPMGFDELPPWQVLLLDPGGWAAVPLGLGLGLVVAGVAAASQLVLVRTVRVALVVAATGLVWALVLDSVTVTPSFSSVPVAPWAGASLQLATAGLVTAAALAARGGRRRLRQRSLSWRQPAVALVVLFAVSSPVLSGLWWLERGAADPIARGEANPLPAFVRAQSELPQQIRTLVLRPSNGRLEYTLLRQRDSQFGDVETSPPANRLADLSAVVSDLASGRGTAPVDRLSEYAVAYVLAVPPVEPALETALDSAPGVLRVANPGEAALWRIERPTGRLQLLDADGAVEVLPSDSVDTTTEVPAGPGDRLLQLAELADDGWSAQVAGSALPVQDLDDWSQGFVVSAGPAQVSISHRNAWRTALQVVELLVVLTLVVMALPSRRAKPEEVV